MAHGNLFLVVIRKLFEIAGGRGVFHHEVAILSVQRVGHDVVAGFLDAVVVGVIFELERIRGIAARACQVGSVVESVVRERGAAADGVTPGVVGEGRAAGVGSKPVRGVVGVGAGIGGPIVLGEEVAAAVVGEAAGTPRAGHTCEAVDVVITQGAVVAGVVAVGNRRGIAKAVVTITSVEQPGTRFDDRHLAGPLACIEGLCGGYAVGISHAGNLAARVVGDACHIRADGGLPAECIGIVVHALAVGIGNLRQRVVAVVKIGKVEGSAIQRQSFACEVAIGIVVVAAHHRAAHGADNVVDPVVTQGDGWRERIGVGDAGEPVARVVGVVNGARIRRSTNALELWIANGVAPIG